MSTLYWDCFSGISGNMAVGSLLDLGVDPEGLKKVLASIPFPEGPLEIVVEHRMKMGINALYFNTVDDEKKDHHHDGDHHRHHRHHSDHHHHSHHDRDHDHNDQGHAHGHDHDLDDESSPKSDSTGKAKASLVEKQCQRGEGKACKSAKRNLKQAQPAMVEAPNRKPDSDERHHDRKKHKKDHHHGQGKHGRGFFEICELIKKSDLSSSSRDLAIHCFRLLGEVEAHIHGTQLADIHFHEVGGRDSIADIVGAAYCINELGITSTYVSPVHVGSGFQKCHHGKMPVPPPATAALLKGYPIFSDPEITGELTTPTGAALIAGLDAKPGLPRGFVYQKIGQGAGSRDLIIPNLLRAFLGSSASSHRVLDSVILLETNIDNATGELLGHAMEKLLGAGALDVTMTPLQMKKGRPGFLLSVLAPFALADGLETMMFRELPTLGIRRQMVQRATLGREAVHLNTRHGVMKGKRIREIDGKLSAKPEFDEIKRAAAKNNTPVRKVQEDLK